MQSLLPDQRRSSQDRSSLFLMLMLGVVIFMMWDMSSREKRQREELERRRQQELVDQPITKKDATEPTVDPTEDETHAVKVDETAVSPGWVTLGSMNPKDPYRMLVTLTNQGAAIARIELNTEKYRDVQELSGYMGQIVVDVQASDREATKEGGGVMVQVLGPGTPAFKASLQVGDRIVRFDLKNKKTETFATTIIKNFSDLRNCLFKTKPGDEIQLGIVRAGREIPLGVFLEQHPMDVIRPESVAYNYSDYRQLGGLRGILFESGEQGRQSDQLSFLATLQSVDRHRLDLPKSLNANNSKLRGIISRDRSLDLELPGVDLRREPWEIVSTTQDEVVFRRTIPAFKLEMFKTYRLRKIEVAEGKTPGVADGYDLTMKIELRNLDNKEHQVAYQLDGPTGLPLEGGWYARKTGPGWSGYGIRDLVVRFQENSPQTIANSVIGSDNVAKPWIDDPLDYIGVDSQYFQCTLRPQKTDEEKDAWHVRSFPIRVGEKNHDWHVLTDISFRLLSREVTLQPAGSPESRLEHEYSLFVGPKDTRILDAYDLGQTISYGWFWFVAQPLLGVLHFFHSLGMNYAMAIIALTVCVRLLMFPISLKQAQGAIKMQQIQPELQALAEKYKDDMQARSRAQSELFKKHNYHPASGCLPLFIQLPIFIGLYKALSIDTGLYGAPLISTAVRWCSDLSAPDMLFDWSSFWISIGWPGFNTGTSPGFVGMFCLGPYFNLLPMLTIALFLTQQAIMMPPPTDDQSRMQRKMMQYMMIFMGFMFFKIPSGLCIYFIASTIWGLAERRFVPKASPTPAREATYDVGGDDPKDKKSPRAKDRKKSKAQPAAPRKEEGFFGKLMREITERAAEQRKLEKTSKKDDRKKKR